MQAETTSITVGAPPELLEAVDAWIAERANSIANPETLTRPEALRQLAAEALKGMGLLSVEADKS